MTDIEGEVTPETVLSQCIRMSNDIMCANFEYIPRIHGYYVTVNNGSRDELLKPIYRNQHWTNQDSSSLAEILQDLISIEYEYTERMTQGETK